MKPYVLFAVQTGSPLCPEMATGVGLTGAEEVVVLLSRELARIGYRVAVCVDNLGGKTDRIVDGVRWTGLDFLEQHILYDPYGKESVLIASMYPNLANLPAFRRHHARKIAWAHSIGFDDVKPEMWLRFNEIVCATRWQKDAMWDRYVSRAFDGGSFGTRPAPTTIPYGINPPERLPKVPGKCLYASSPDRGLLRLLKAWPMVRKESPEATLFVAYGRDRMRDRAKHDEAVAAELDQIEFHLHAQSGIGGVVDLGFLPKPDLYRHIGEAKAFVYPTTFEETGCLIGQKAVAAGAVPVYSPKGCLPEIFAGVKYARPLSEDADDAEIARKVSEALASPPVQGVSFPTWEQVAAQWATLLGD